MDRSPQNSRTFRLPSDVETDADPVPGSFKTEDVPLVSSRPMTADKKTVNPSAMLVNGEQLEEGEHGGRYYSDPSLISAGAAPFGCSGEGGQNLSSTALPYGQSGLVPYPDARAPVQISSPSSEQQSLKTQMTPTWEPRNPSRQVAAVKEEGQHRPSSFLSPEEDDSNREKSVSLPYPSEERGYDSGPDQEDDEDIEFYDFFLVFSEADKEHARNIMDLLTNCKLKGCMLEKDFPAGVSPFKNIEDAINRSTYTVVVLTENFTTDRWCEKKLQTSLIEAIDNPDKYNSVIPIIPKPELMPRRKIPSELRSVSPLDMTSDYFESKIKQTFKTKERKKREKKRQESRTRQLRSVYSVPTNLSSQVDFESLSAGKSSQSLGQLNRGNATTVAEREGKSTWFQKLTGSVEKRHAASEVQRMGPSNTSGQSIQGQKHAGSGTTKGKTVNRLGKSGSAHRLVDKEASCLLPDRSHQMLQTGQSADDRPSLAMQGPPTERYNPEAAGTPPASNQLHEQDASFSSTSDPQGQAMDVGADNGSEVEATGEVGGFVWVERRNDGQSANTVNVAPGNGVASIQVECQKGGDLRNKDVTKQTSLQFKDDRMEVSPGSEHPTDPSMSSTAGDSLYKMREGTPSNEQTPGEMYAPGAGGGQAPGVGNIPVIACQAPMIPQPYPGQMVTNVYNIYSPRNIQIGNQNAMEKDDVVTDGPEDAVFYVPPMPYPPNMGATPMTAPNPMGQGQQKTKASDDTARKMNEEYDIDDETDVKVPVEPEYDIEDETHVKVPIKPKVQPRQLSPAEIARSESYSSADEAHEETCVMSVAADMAEDLNLNTIDGSTLVKEVQNLQQANEESMTAAASVPKQRKGGNFLSFFGRGRKK